MPRGIRNNGSNSELAKAYVHGRLDEARDTGIAKLEKQLTQKLFYWANHISVHPLELKSLMGTISVGTESNHLSGAGMQLSTGVTEGRKSLSAVEGVELPHVPSPRGNRRSSGNSQDAANQVTSLPAPDNKRGIAGWFNKDGSPMTREQRKNEAHRRLLKRTDPLAKAMLRKKADQKLAAKKLVDRQKKKQQDQAQQPKNNGKRNMAFQRIYQARHNAKLRGLPLPPLPGEAPSSAAEQINVA